MKLQGNSVFAKDNEPFEKLMRRFKKKVQDSGLLQDLTKREFYEKPTSIKKRKRSAAKNRWKKELAKQQLPPKLF
jgi:small subunit ribosomal protein S21